jgi:DNA (cytosine-5)-methyltransferase 1
VDEVAIAKRKGKAIETEDPVEIQAPKVLPSLSSLDIFAGCGGLSEGLHQSGILIVIFLF